jgi:autotransporter-associated beta strand protein
MRKSSIQLALASAVGMALTGMVQSARAAAPAVDGTLDTALYGSPLATQTVNTGFGDSTVGDGTSSGGSELDAAYGTVANGNLYLFFAGNFENNGNHVNIFIADGRSGGQNVLNANSSSGSLSNSNGLTFPSGFNATYAIDGNDYSNTFYFDQYDLTRNTANYIGSVPLTGGVGNNQNLNGIAIGVNNTNAAGVNGSTGSAANASAADAVTTGLELEIPLAALGYPTGSVQVLADINNNNDNYLSNQFLPGLPVGYGNLATPSSTNLATDGANITPFSVTVPATPNGVWELTGGGSWNNSSSWSNGVIPTGIGQAVAFATATANSVVTVDGAFTVGAITFNSTYSYTLAPGSGGVLTMNNGSSQATITSYGGNQTISAPLVLASNTVVTAVSRGNSIAISGNISGSGSLTVDSQGGTSVVNLSGSNSYTGGTIVNGGNLQLGSASALPAGTALALSALDLPAGVLDLNGFSTSISSLTVLTGPNTQNVGAVARIINTTATAGTSTLTYAGNASNPSTFNGIISDSSGSGGGTTALLVTSGSLTLTNSNFYGGATNVSGGTLTLGATGALPSGTNLTIGSGATVVASNLGTATALTVNSLSDAGKLNLNNNGLIIQTGSLSTINALLASGYNNGGWNGSSGITSSTASADTTYLTALGVIVNDTGTGTPLYGTGGEIANTFDGVTPVDGNILVGYTYYGDTNLDGAVDGSDYTNVDNGFNNHLTGWVNGDFNYDGKVDGSDYTLIDNAYNMQGPSLGVNPAGLIASSTEQIAGSSAVPEPTSLGLLVMAGIPMLRRRRRLN